MRAGPDCWEIALWAALAASCNTRPPQDELDAGGPDDASGPALDADTNDADGVIGESGDGPAHGDAADAMLPERDATVADVACQVCDPPGGQYCGQILEPCSTKTLDCGVECRQPGFACGGRGYTNLCGAAPDSGLCDVVSCLQAGFRYCGLVGDGCGGTLDCGECPGPSMICGGGGIRGVCAAREPACQPLTCTNATARYCGVIGDGCGGSLDCGLCAEGDVCGAAIPHMCGSDPPGILVPPPAPVPAPLPAPPPPMVPIPPPPD